MSKTSLQTEDASMVEGYKHTHTHTHTQANARVFTQVNTSQHESTRVKMCLTRVNKSQYESKTDLYHEKQAR